MIRAYDARFGGIRAKDGLTGEKRRDNYSFHRRRIIKELKTYDEVYLVCPSSDGINNHTITYTLDKAGTRGPAALMCNAFTEQQQKDLLNYMCSTHEV